jgi:hypothetical protein
MLLHSFILPALTFNFGEAGAFKLLTFTILWYERHGHLILYSGQDFVCAPHSA